MKYLLTPVFCLLLFSVTFAQKNVPDLMKAKEEFAGLFFKAPLAMKESWLKRLTEVNEVFFNVYGEYAVKYFNGVVKGKDSKQATLKIAEIADSLNTWFIERRVLDSSLEDMERLKDILPAIADTTCNCISRKLKYRDSILPGEMNGLDACYTAYVSDLHAAMRLRLAFAGYNIAQAWHGSQTTSEYVISHCRPIYKFIKKTLINTEAEQYVNSRDFYIDELPKLVKHLDKTNKTDSLLLIFPGYKEYQAQIKLFALLHNEGANVKTINSGDTLIKTITYSTNQYTNPHIDGQLKLYLSNDALPLLYKFIYILRAKITNLAALEKGFKQSDIVEPPPPQQFVAPKP